MNRSRHIDLRITGGPRGYLLRPVTQAGIRWAYGHFEQARWQGAAVLLDRTELQRVLCCCAVEDLRMMPDRSN